MIIAVDFDGTCVTHDFPEVGQYIGAEEVLLEILAAGHNLVLNTMRSEEDLIPAVQWFKDRGIHLYGVNLNPDQRSWTSSPKVYAHLYIDDAAVGTPLVVGQHPRPYVDWGKMRWLLKRKGVL